MTGNDTEKIHLRLKLEWDLAWKHIENSNQIFWKLFASQIVINGSALAWSLSKTPLPHLLLLGLLVINLVMLLIYQRETYALTENLIQINLIRKQLPVSPELCFHAGSKEKGLTKNYVYILHVLFILVPAYLFLKGNIFSDAILQSFKCLTAITATLGIIIVIVTFVVFILIRKKFKSKLMQDSCD